ncbi:MAG TPA: autotransporter assembly complex family protein [Caulobacteraceae bacterium]
MKARRLAIAAGAAALLGISAPPALADEPKASVDGDLDKALRQEIQRAVGTSRTRPDSSFDARQRASDAVGDAIAVLRSEGYYGYDVEPDVADGEPPQPVIHVQTGPRFVIQSPSVEWVGAAPVDAAAKAGLDSLKLTPGAPGRAADVVAAEGRVVAAIEQQGYADAVAQPRVVVVDHADHSVRPTFKIAAGDLVKLDGVTVITDGRTNPLWVRGLAPWKHGDVYTPKAVAELERRLSDVGVYDQVTVALAPKDKAIDGLRPVIVSLADRPPHTLELGAGFSTTGGTTVNTNNLEGGADFSSAEGSGIDGKLIWYNRLHRADTLTLGAKIYNIQQKLDLELDLPHWRRPGQTLKVGAGLFGDRTRAFNDYGGGARAEVERRYSRTSYVSLGAAADFVTTMEKTAVNSQALPVGETLKLFIPSILAAFAIDKSNDLLNPTHGWRMDMRAEPTVVTGDRKLTYLKLQGEASAYLPLGRGAGTVLAARAHVGSIIGGRIPDVPTDRRFFAGGGGSVRGYGYQAVGPRLSDNTPEGGLSLVETSVEVRQRVSGRWGVVGFADAGSVGSTSAPDFKNMRAGVGVGVRYDLGFGPIRFDIATPIERRKGDAPFQVYISIGQSF